MAKQTYTTGQVLTAAQMTTLQSNDFNQTVSAKTASYTLVAADAGTRITMSNASATTVTVNTAIFAAGDTLQITNIGAGICTVTAGTATVSTAGVLTLAQNASGTLYFTSTGVSIFNGSAAAAASGPSFSAFASATQSLVAVTNTKMAMNTELFDTDSCYDTTTFRFTPTKAGYYEVSAVANCAQSASAGRLLAEIHKNGTANLRIADNTVSNTNNDGAAGGTMIIELNGTTDFIEFFVLSVIATTRSSGSDRTRFSAVFLRGL